MDSICKRGDVFLPNQKIKKSLEKSARILKEKIGICMILGILVAVIAACHMAGESLQERMQKREVVSQDIKTMIEVFSEKKSSQNEKILKLLSDPSKYAILKMIKTKAYYGAEIAKAMNLKTSTISYHLNACVDAQLVHVHKVENKIYFELNHETFNQFIQTLKSDFE